MTRRVLITGASRGIGRATALQLASDGFDIAVHYFSDRNAASEVAEKIQALGRSASLLGFDLAEPQAVRTNIEKDMDKNGAFYGIVCNAGLHKDAAFPAMTNEGWDSVIRTNLDGFYHVVQPCIMPMIHRRDGGRIIAMSSISGLIGNRGQVNYSAAKAGLIGATKALAIELAKRQITVNAIAPGLIETAMTAEIDDKLIREVIPLRRMGTAQEVASLVGYLFSENAGYITRQVVSVNGGMF